MSSPEEKGVFELLGAAAGDPADLLEQMSLATQTEIFACIKAHGNKERPREELMIDVLAHLRIDPDFRVMTNQLSALHPENRDKDVMETLARPTFMITLDRMQQNGWVSNRYALTQAGQQEARRSHGSIERKSP